MSPALIVEGPTEQLERLLEELDNDYAVVPVSSPRQAQIWRLWFDLEDDGGNDSSAFERRQSYQLALEILDRIIAARNSGGLRLTLLIQLSISLAQVWDTSVSLDREAVDQLALCDCGAWVTASLVSD